MTGIHFKTLTGKTISIDVDENDTVLQVKQKIQDVVGKVPPDQIHILWGGRKFVDDKLFFSYSTKTNPINLGSTLSLSIPHEIESKLQPPVPVSLKKYAGLGCAAGAIGCFGYRALTSPKPYSSHIKSTVICGLGGAAVGALFAVYKNAHQGRV